MIYLLNADLNGNDSIAHLIDGGKVKELECGTFEAFDNHSRALLTKVSSGDIVIVDTLTSLANTTRGDAKLGNDESESLWDKREKFLGDKNYLTVYELAGQLIMRRLKNLRARGCHLITTTHEDEQRDDGTLMRKRAPALNAALYRSLMGASSDVLRMQVLTDPITNSKGEVKVPAGVRTLQLRVTDDAVIKTHVRREIGEKLPKYIYNPSWEKLVKVLGKTPSWLVLYGPPGVGKTSLSTDAAEIPHDQSETTPGTESGAAD
jgi:hypothetical protein